MEPSTSSSTNAHLQGFTEKDEQALPIPVRFAMPTTDEELATEKKENAKSLNTIKSTNWAVNTWQQWTAHRRKVCLSLDCPPHLYTCTNWQLDYWISKFILEARKTNGQPYPPNKQPLQHLLWTYEIRS